MSSRTVILNHKQWMRCWKDMCSMMGFVPAWDQYMRHFQYFGGINCDLTPDEGFVISFETTNDAVVFKLRWT